MMLKIDIDKKELSCEFDNKLKTLLRLWGMNKAHVTIKGTYKGYHIYVLLPESLSDKDIIIAQLVLGSDVWRELFNYERVLLNEEDWNILFKEKRKNNKIVSRETEYKMYEVVIDG